MRTAEQLAGIELVDGWKITQLLPRKPTATGGNFSVGYLCENVDGRKGFLKALDYSDALHKANTSQLLHELTGAYLFEKDLYEKCENHLLSRVSRCLGYGTVPAQNSSHHHVNYMIFELANGDIRSQLDDMAVTDTVFILKTLHHVATGLKQLHGARIAHQDLKPSNVLVFNPEVGSKIGDLGRGWTQDRPGPYDEFKIAGDRSYAPIEMQYNMVHENANLRRFGCDMYHLGNLTAFLFSRLNINALITANLRPEFRSNFWAGTYEDVLPYVQAAFEVALDEIAKHVPQLIRSDIRMTISEFCQPDFARRGHALNRFSGSNPFSLERYLSRFDLLAYRVETKAGKVAS